MFDNVMIDIETFGTTSFSSVVSIAAVQFDIERGWYGQEFYTEISPESCLAMGLHEDEETIDWWQHTNPGELYNIRKRGIPLELAIVHFDSWFRSRNDVALVKVWGNSNRFDLGLIENIYTVGGASIPWSFKNERDVRTLVSFAPEIKDEEPAVGMAHNALDDCKFQINYCAKIYRKIKNSLSK